MRSSASYRDEYLTLVPATNAPMIQDAEGTNETLNVDFSASYAINDHLTISLEGLNLTDEANDQFIDTQTNRVLCIRTPGGRCFWGRVTSFEVDAP